MEYFLRDTYLFFNTMEFRCFDYPLPIYFKEVNLWRQLCF